MTAREATPRPTPRTRLRLRMLALVAACAAAPALAAAPPEGAEAAPVAAQSLGGTVDRLLQEGKPEAAEVLLAAVLKRDPGNQQARFLTGMVAMTRGEHARAIRIFRAMLIDHPEAVRVRLELARAFFLDKDYANADRQFRFARTGRHPSEVLANIDQYLYAIRQAKDWSWSFSAALAPDTNVNAGASAREVTLFGLPFELSEDARKHSGVGLALDGSLEYAPRLSARTRLRLGAGAQRREYQGSEFDDTTLALHAGPRLVSSRWDVSLLGTGFARWFGGDPLLRGGGGRIEATWYPSARFAVSGALGAQWLDYRRDSARSGMLWSANLGVFHPLGPTSAATVKASVNRQEARVPGYGNWNGFLAAGYYRDLPAGFSVYFEPSIGFARYDAALPAFGKPRSDKLIGAQLAVLNRHIVLDRFTPRLAYTVTRQSSNIALYSFTRHRVEVGLTASF